MRRIASWLAAFLAALLLALPPAAARQPPTDPDALVRDIESTWREVQSLRASFVQESRTAAGEGVRQKGEVLLKRPRSMRWDFKGPQARLFVTDGDRMWVYSPDANQCILYKDLGAAAGASGLGLLNQLDRLTERFEVVVEDPRPRDGFKLRLVPRDPQAAPFKELRLELARRRYLLRRVTILDALGNVTELSFSQVRLNVDLEDSLFHFEPPKGCQLIDADGLAP